MPCPFFVPEHPLEPGPWTNLPRLPLGDAYSGTCRARPDEFHIPPESLQRELCNCGYARGRCEHFPAGDAADAVRFSVSESGEGRLRLIYIVEKEHFPALHGAVEFSTKDDVFPDSDADELLAIQARAFVQSYLRISRP